MNVVPTLPDRATELLTALGADVEQVAASLQAAGITGEHRRSDRCPLAVFLLRSGLGAYEVDIDYDEATLWFIDAGCRYFERVDLPDPVTEFVYAFDGGAFNYLLAAGAA